MEGNLIKDSGDLFLDGILLFDMIHPQHPDGAAGCLDDIQQSPDGGGLSRAVLADEAHDAAPGDSETDSVQGKAVVFLGQFLDLNGIFVKLLATILKRRD